MPHADADENDAGPPVADGSIGNLSSGRRPHDFGRAYERRCLAHLSVVGSSFAMLVAAMAGARQQAPARRPVFLTQASVFVLAKGRFERSAPFPGDAERPRRHQQPGQDRGGKLSPTRASHGYFRDRRGRFTRIDFPGAAGTAVRHQRPRPDRGHLQRHQSGRARG